MSLLFRSQERVSAAKLNRLAALQASGGGGGGGGVLRPTVVEVPDATHEPGLGVDWRYFVCTNAGGCSITIPADDTTDFPIGTLLTYEQGNTGGLTIIPDTVGLDDSVAINLRPGKLEQTGAAHSVIFLIKTAANTWTLYGDLADA